MDGINPGSIDECNSIRGSCAEALFVSSCIFTFYVSWEPDHRA